VTARSLLLLAACVALLTPAWRALGRWLVRRLRARAAPRRLAAGERALLAQWCTLYRRAPPSVRTAAEARTDELLAQLRFVGCAGLEITAVMRLTIAFQASLLLGRLGTAICEELGAVLVYPDSFLAPRQRVDAAGVVTETQEPLSGETQGTTRIVLSWADVRAGLGDGAHGNVVLHEFAHYLDHALDRTLSAPAPGRSWHQLLSREYAALRAAVDRGEPTLIDPYGAQAEAEFFAVATETFFAEPVALAARHAELYAALARIYALDPAGWS